MADNSAKIVLNASVDGVLRAADQVKKKFSEVGEQGGKAGEKMLAGLGRSLLTAGALIRVVKGVAEAFNEAATNAAKISKEAGGSRLDAERAGQRLGLSSGQVGAFLSKEGPLSQAERVQAIQSVGSAKGPGGRAVGSRDAWQMLDIIGQGMKTSGEVTGAFEKQGRRGLERQAGESRLGLATLGDEARQELFARQDTAAQERRRLGTAGESGRAERVRVAKMEALMAENPGANAFRSAVGSAVPGGEQIIQAGDRSGLSGLMQLTPQGVTNMLLQKLVSYARPSLNASANGP